MASVDVPPGPPPTGPYGGSSNDFRPLGAGAQGPPSMLNALQGMVANVHTAAREQEKSTKDILAMTERTALVLGTTLDRAETLLVTGAAQRERAGAVTLGDTDALPSGAITTRVPGAPETGERAARGRPTTEVPEGDADQRAATPSTAVPRGSDRPRRPGVPTSLPGRGGNVEGALDEAEEGGRREYFPRTFKEGQRTNVGSLRQTAAANINTRLAEMSKAQEQWYFDEETNQPRVRMVPTGSPTLAPQDDPGWRARAMGRAQNFAGGMAEGRTAGQAFQAAAAGSPRLMAVAKGAGVAGAAYVGVNTALNFAESQREGNARFQQMIGGAAQDGFGERWQQNLFRLGNRGFMSGRDSETIYQGAAAQYGRDDDMRGIYQEAAIDLRRHAGLGAQDSTRLLSMAADEGVRNLRGLASSIRAVGEAAVEAGMGAQAGRELFESNFRQFSSMGHTTGRIDAAEAMTEMQLGLGQRFQGVDFSGQQSDVYEMMMAQQLGMTRSDFQVATAEGTPGATAKVLKGRSAVMNSVFGSYMGGAPGAALRARLEAELRSNNMEPLSPDQLNRVGREAYEAGEIGDVNSLVTHFHQAGMRNVEPGATPALLAQWAYGKLDPSRTHAAQVEAATTSVRDPSVNSGSSFDHREAARGNKALDAGAEFLNLDRDSIEDQLVNRGSFNTSHKTAWWDEDRSMETQVENALKNQMLGLDDLFGEATWLSVGGKFSKNMSNLDDPDARFEVMTADGKKTVNAKELVEDFGDQLQAAPQDIRIISSGVYNDRTVGDLLNLEAGEEGFEVTSDKRSYDGGMSVDEAEEKRSEDVKGDTSRVEISMDPDLLRVLQVQVNGADYSPYYATGAPPPASHQVSPEGWQIAEDGN